MIRPYDDRREEKDVDVRGTCEGRRRTGHGTEPFCCPGRQSALGWRGRLALAADTAMLRWRDAADSASWLCARVGGLVSDTDSLVLYSGSDFERREEDSFGMQDREDALMSSSMCKSESIQYFDK